MKRFASASAMLAVSLCVAGAALAASSSSAPPPAGSVAKRHMIVAAEPDASEAGRAMLRTGGSAVDAAIAAQMVLTLVEPQSSGIGGGSYLVVSEGTGLFALEQVPWIDFVCPVVGARREPALAGAAQVGIGTRPAVTCANT